MAAITGIDGATPAANADASIDSVANGDVAKPAAEDKRISGSISQAFGDTVDSKGGQAAATPAPTIAAQSAVAAALVGVAGKPVISREAILAVVRGEKAIEDVVKLKDPELAKILAEHAKDARTLAESLPKRAPKIVVLGTARSKDKPGENGYRDYVWGYELGQESARRKMAMGTGGGPGAMTAPLAGLNAMVELIKMGQEKFDPAAPPQGVAPGSDVDDLDGQGDNIILPFEQELNSHVKDKASFERFLFRMEALFRNTTAQIHTPGGFGTLAEAFSGLSLRLSRDIEDPVIFGAVDDYWEKLNAAFATLLPKEDAAPLGRTMRGFKDIIDTIADERRVANEEPIEPFIARELYDIAQGLAAIDGAPEAITFIGGEGEISKASAEVIAGIAKGVSQDGETLRIGGSKVVDAAVKRGTGKLGLQAFALDDGGCKGVSYNRVNDLLVLRDMLTTKTKALVVTPDSMQALAMLFVAACDIQTKEMPKIPIVVIDPDGKFEAVRKTMGEVLLSQNADGTPRRRYINPEDLDIFTVVKTKEEALAKLRQPKPQA